MFVRPNIFLALLGLSSVLATPTPDYSNSNNGNGNSGNDNSRGGNAGVQVINLSGGDGGNSKDASNNMGDNTQGSSSSTSSGSGMSSSQNNNNGQISSSQSSGSSSSSSTESTGSTIPSVFTKAFDPTQITLDALFGGNQIADGQKLSSSEASQAPSFALGDSSGLSTQAKYIIILIDPDVSAPNTAPQGLHYMQTDFQANGDKLELSSSSQPTVPYAGPDKASGSGTHRFIFLLYAQPPDFDTKSMKGVTQQGFNAADWKTQNGLQPAEAGVHFVAVVSGSGSSGNSYTATSDSGSAATSEVATSTSELAAASSMATSMAISMATSMASSSVEAVPPATTAEVAATSAAEVPGSTVISLVTATETSCDCTATASSLAAAPPASSAVAAPPPVVSSAVASSVATAAPSTGATLVVSPPVGASSVVGAASPAQTIKVIVGGSAGLVYTPSSVSANVGDTVLFDFLSKNHTATQSTLAQPCTFMPGGVKSGFRFNPQSIEGKETFTFSVNDTKPKWFYCAQMGHCAQGMVFAINPGAKLDQFVAAAKATGGNSTAGNGTTGGLPTVQPGSAATANSAIGMLMSIVALGMMFVA